MLLLLVAAPAATVMKAAEAALVAPATKHSAPGHVLNVSCCAVHKLSD